ncbi:hypothetical protein Ancab_004822 [Ancistrocladus abbreviatus]
MISRTSHAFFHSKVKAWLKEGKEVHLREWKAADVKILHTFQLLTVKPFVYLVLQGLDSVIGCVEDMNEWLGIFNVKLRRMREDIELVGKGKLQVLKPLILLLHLYKARLRNAYLKEVSEEVKSVSSFFGHNTNKDKVHLFDDSDRTTDCHGTNSFIPDSVDRSHNGSLGTAPQDRDRKAEDEKPENSAFSLHRALDVLPSPNTMAAQPLEGKAGASKRRQILSWPSLTHSSDRGMMAEHFQIRDGLGPYGPSGASDLPPLKEDGPNSPIGLISRLGFSSSARPKISSNAAQCRCPTSNPGFGPCNSNSNSMPQNSLPTNTSKSEYKSNELFSIIAKSKPLPLSNNENKKRQHRAKSKRKGINHLAKIIHGPLSLKIRSRKQKKSRGSIADSVGDGIREEESNEASTVDESQFLNMNQIVVANEEK